jgi:hypothetical protein
MATIPLDEKFIGLSASVDTTQRRSELINAQSQAYTMQDIVDTTRPYKVFTALLTQSGDDDPRSMQGDGGGDISSATKGTTVQIFANINNINYSSIGAPNSNVGTYFILTQDITLSNLDNDTIFSLNIGAPVATVLENTIGNIWFTYNGVGNYSANSDGLFTTNKSIILSIPNQYVESPSDLYNYQAYNTGIDSFNLTSFMNYLSEDGLYGGYAQNTIEIRVYN